MNINRNSIQKININFVFKFNPNINEDTDGFIYKIKIHDSISGLMLFQNSERNIFYITPYETLISFQVFLPIKPTDPFNKIFI